MLSFPNCKINLGLYITARREDGYHDLETVFYPVPLKDALEIVPARDESRVHVTGLPVAGRPIDNLACKAYWLMKSVYREKVPELDIHLHKVIPMGAGLGGGSADAAFMLNLVDKYCGLDLTEKELLDLALQLGSDCPFFIHNTPQFARGRGELMETLTLTLDGYYLVLVSPDIHVSTAEAFGMINPRPAPFDLRGLSELPVEEWKDHITNDFEQPVFSRHPELRRIKERLYDQGAVYASMSGSGSSVYGLFTGEAAMDFPGARTFTLQL